MYIYLVKSVVLIKPCPKRFHFQPFKSRHAIVKRRPDEILEDIVVGTLQRLLGVVLGVVVLRGTDAAQKCPGTAALGAEPGP
jgi:hypothetical protein